MRRISSSGRGRPDRFGLDQHPWPVLSWTALHGGELQPKLQPCAPQQRSRHAVLIYAWAKDCTGRGVVIGSA